MRNKDGQKLHDDGVAAKANALILAGCQLVLSDLPGNQKPPALSGYIPDIYAERVFYLGAGGIPLKKEIYVVEVETNDSKDSQETMLQVNALRNWCNIHGSFFQLIVV